MREIVIENPTRIVNLHKGLDYIPGLYVKVETPNGSYVATWEHRPQAGCVMLEAEDGKTGLCRNHVLIASLASFNKRTGDWPDGCDVPVLAEKDSRAFLDAEGIPDDSWGTFNALLAD